MAISTRIGDADLAVLNDQFESQEPQDIIRWAVETFGDGLSVGASFGGGARNFKR